MAGIQIKIDVSQANKNLESFKQNINKTNVTINNSTKVINNFQKEIKESGQTIANSDKYMNAMATALQSIQKQTKQTNLRLNKINTTLKSTSKTTNQVTNNVNKINTSLKQTPQNVNRVNDSFSKFGKNLSNINNMLSQFGVGLSLYIFKQLAEDILSTGAQFETAIAAIGGITGEYIGGKATDDFIKLQNEILRLGETTEYTSNQVAEATRYIVQTGFSVQQAYEALPGVLDLATAGQIDLARAADIATNALRVFSIEEENLTSVNDAFIATITQSNVNVDQLGEALKFAGPAARAFGSELEPTVALLGKLGDAGLQGSLAGTQLGQAIQRAGDVFEKFNEELPTESKYGPVVDALDLLEKKSLSAIETYELFTERAGRAFAIFRTVGSEEIKGFIDNIRESEGVSKRLADTIRDTTLGAFKELKSAIESIKIKAFMDNSDTLKESLNNLTTSIRTNSSSYIALAGSLLKVVEGYNYLVIAAGKFLELTELGRLNAYVSVLEKQKDILLETRRATSKNVSIVGGEVVSEQDVFSEEDDKRLKDIITKIRDAREEISNIRNSAAGILPEAAKMKEKLDLLTKENAELTKTTKLSQLLGDLDDIRAKNAEFNLNKYQAAEAKLTKTVNEKLAIFRNEIAIREELLEIGEVPKQQVEDEIDAYKALISEYEKFLPLEIKRLQNKFKVNKYIETESEKIARLRKEETARLSAANDLMTLQKGITDKILESSGYTLSAREEVDKKNKALEEEANLQIELLELEKTRPEVTEETAALIDQQISKVKELLKLQKEQNEESLKFSSILKQIPEDIENLIVDVFNGESFGDGLLSILESTFDKAASFAGDKFGDYVGNKLDNVVSDLFIGFGEEYVIGASNLISGIASGGLTSLAGVAANTLMEGFFGDKAPSKAQLASEEIDSLITELSTEFSELRDSINKNTQALTDNDYEIGLSNILSDFSDRLQTDFSTLTGPMFGRYNLREVGQGIGLSDELSLVQVAQEISRLSTDEIMKLGSLGNTNIIGDGLFEELKIDQFKEDVDNYIEAFNSLNDILSSELTLFAQDIQSEAVSIIESFTTLDPALSQVTDLESAKSVLEETIALIGEDLPSNVGAAKDALEDVNEALYLSRVELELTKQSLDANIDSYVATAQGLDTTVSDAFAQVNQDFVGFAQQMISLGATSEDLTKLEAKRLLVLEATAQSLISTATAPITSVNSQIAQYSSGLSDSDYLLSTIETALQDPDLGYEDLSGLATMFGTAYTSGLQEIETSVSETIAAEQEAAELWQDVLDLQAQLSDKISDQIQSLTFSSYNPALINVQAGQAQQTYQGYLTAALTGDSEAINTFVDFTTTFLDLQQQNLGSSEAYQKIFQDTLDDLEMVQGMIDQGDFNDEFLAKLKLQNNIAKLDLAQSTRIRKATEKFNLKMEGLGDEIATRIGDIVTEELGDASQDPIISSLYSIELNVANIAGMLGVAATEPVIEEPIEPTVNEETAIPGGFDPWNWTSNNTKASNFTNNRTYDTFTINITMPNGVTEQQVIDISKDQINSYDIDLTRRGITSSNRSTRVRG